MIKNFRSIEHVIFFRRLSILGKWISPNQISAIGFVATLISALLIYKNLFLLASMTVLIHLICDGLDGHIARKYNKASQLGFLIDHVLDRLSDLILFPILG